MRRQRFRFLVPFASGVAAAALFLGLSGSVTSLAATRYEDLNLFTSVLNLVRKNYVEPVDESALIEGAVRGMLATLDPHSSYLAPDVFSVLESLKLMLMIVVGGLGSIPGAIFGAILVSLLPVGLSFLKDVLPAGIGQQAGLEPMLFGLIIVVFIVFEPEGIHGRWMKIRYFFETFPYYRKSSFVRQKSYLRTERMR